MRDRAARAEVWEEGAVQWEREEDEHPNVDEDRVQSNSARRNISREGEIYSEDAREIFPILLLDNEHRSRDILQLKSSWTGSKKVHVTFANVNSGFLIINIIAGISTLHMLNCLPEYVPGSKDGRGGGWRRENANCNEGWERREDEQMHG